jgi:hypothetical protein
MYLSQNAVNEDQPWVLTATPFITRRNKNKGGGVLLTPIHVNLDRLHLQHQTGQQIFLQVYQINVKGG